MYNGAAPVCRHEFILVQQIGNGIDVAAYGAAGKRQRVEKTLALSGLLRIVDVVVRNCWRDGAGDDAIKRARSGKAAELNGLKKQLRRVVKSRDIGSREPVSQPYPQKRKTLHGIAGEGGEAGTVLIVILDELRIDANGLSQEKSFVL